MLAQLSQLPDSQSAGPMDYVSAFSVLTILIFLVVGYINDRRSKPR